MAKFEWGGIGKAEGLFIFGNEEGTFTFTPRQILQTSTESENGLAPVPVTHERAKQRASRLAEELIAYLIDHPNA